MSHPNEQDLALYATHDLTFFSRLTVSRHVRNCQACAEVVAEYREITAELANATPQIEDWDILAAEMGANIRLGLEAGACLNDAALPLPFAPVLPNRDRALPNRDREGAALRNRPAPNPLFNPRLALAMASLMILAAAGIALRPDQPKPAPTVLAQQSVKVDTEGVTITNVYME